MGSTIAGMFPQQQINASWSGNPAVQPFQSQLGNVFGAYLGQYGANLPGYKGSLTAGQTPQMSTANQMFQSAIGGYDPSRFQDIYSKFAGIAGGQGPNLQAYMDAVSKRARNEWNQNVMPGIVEKTRGYGRGSIIPESIARAGTTFNENLAGTMAPYMLQAGQGDIQNKLAGITGMGQTATSMSQLPMQLAKSYGDWGVLNQQLAQDDKNREYEEYKRTSMGMLPYMLQFSSQNQGSNTKPDYIPSQIGQQVGSGINTALQLWSLLR